MTTLQDEPAEVFAMICLTTKHRVIAYCEISRGTLDATLEGWRGRESAMDLDVETLLVEIDRLGLLPGELVPSAEAPPSGPVAPRKRAKAG